MSHAAGSTSSQGNPNANAAQLMHQPLDSIGQDPALQRCGVCKCNLEILQRQLCQLWCDRSDLSLASVTVSGNRGPGLLAIYSAPDIAGGEFSGNSGPGIECRHGSNAAIRGVLLRRNAGGVRCSLAAEPLIDRCTFEENSEFGVLCESGSNAKIKGCTFSELPAPGIVVKDVSRPVITGNRFPKQGIAIRMEGDQKLDAWDNVWPEGVPRRTLVEEPSSRPGRYRINLERKP